MRDEVAVITGAASGIGCHFAGATAKSGYRLVLTDVNFESLSTVFEESDGLILCQHDIRDRDRWRSVLDEARARFGRLDFLFNIAGVIEPAYSAEAE